jgi:hypothetical protein
MSNLRNPEYVAAAATDCQNTATNIDQRHTLKSFVIDIQTRWLGMRRRRSGR